MTVSGTLLLGCNHTELGDVVIEESSSNLAIGLSRGRFPKGYAHVDPNEDAVFAATDGTTTILAAADGHTGFDAAHEAILTIVDLAPQLISVDLETIVSELASAAVAGVARMIPTLPSPRDASATALTIVAVRDAMLATVTFGDTGCFVATKRRAALIGTDTDFLSPDTDSNAVHVDTAEVPCKSRIVVASDGLTDFASPMDRVLRSAVKQPPKAAVESLIDAAFAGGAGDNIAVAVFDPGV